AAQQMLIVKFALELHKSGKTMRSIVATVKRILFDNEGMPLTSQWIKERFDDLGYDYEDQEARKAWQRLNRSPDTRLATALREKYKRLERHIFEHAQVDNPEIEAQKQGFPSGWSRHIGGDDEYYDMYIDRYSKRGLVSVWKDRAGSWWWEPRDGSVREQSLSKYEAIDAAERWLNEDEYRPRNPRGK